MTTPSDPGSVAQQPMELSELDLAAITAGGFLGLRTPRFFKDLDDAVRDAGGWLFVGATALALSSGSCLVSPGRLVCRV